MKLGLIIGNLTKDPEYKTLNDGTPVTNFTVAVNEKGKRAQNEPPEFYKVETWRGLADTCAQALHKGSKVGVVGKMKTIQFDGQNGPVKLQVITASEIEFLTPRQDQNGQYQQPQYQDQNTGYQQGQYQGQYQQPAGQYLPQQQQQYQQQAPPPQQQQQYPQQVPPPPQQQYQQQAPPPPQVPPAQQPQQQAAGAAPVPDPIGEFGEFPPLDDAELPF